MTTDYRPIDCDRHSVLELLATRRVRATVKANDDAGRALTLEGIVTDVLTRRGEEFLILRDQAGHDRAVRLDRLQALYATTGAMLWQQAGASGAAR